MPKQFMFEEEGRRKVLQGIRQLAGAVKVTLGPGGRNVILQKSFGSPLATRDGVTVAKEVELADPFQNLGAKLEESKYREALDTPTLQVLDLATPPKSRSAPRRAMLTAVKALRFAPTRSADFAGACGGLDGACAWRVAVPAGDGRTGASGGGSELWVLPLGSDAPGFDEERV